MGRGGGNVTNPLNLLDVIRDICRLQADCFRAEAKAGLEFRTRLAQRNVQALAESAAVPTNHSINQIGELS